MLFWMFVLFHSPLGFLFFLLHPVSASAAPSSAALLSTQHQHNTINTGATLGGPRSHFAPVCVAGAALGGPSVILHRRFSTRSASREVRGSPATIEYYAACAWQVQQLEDHVSFCVAGAALEASITVSLCGTCSTWRTSVGRCSTRSSSREVRGNPATMVYYGRRLLWRGRCSKRRQHCDQNPKSPLPFPVLKG